MVVVGTYLLCLTYGLSLTYHSHSSLSLLQWFNYEGDEKVDWPFWLSCKMKKKDPQKELLRLRWKNNRYADDHDKAVYLYQQLVLLKANVKVLHPGVPDRFVSR